MLTLLTSMGGFIFGFDIGQISDILLMDDFKQRFANHCTNPSDGSTCTFSDVRSGLIVSLLSVGTLMGALLGAPYVSAMHRQTRAC
jgi:MFS transporter, SP family, sugar:H+ symporter